MNYSLKLEYKRWLEVKGNSCFKTMKISFEEALKDDDLLIEFLDIDEELIEEKVLNYEKRIKKDLIKKRIEVKQTR